MTLPLFPSGDPLMALKVRDLRDYQDRCIKQLREMVTKGLRRILIVAPVASGKMFVIAAIIKTSALPVIFVCHRMELVDQCAEELAALGITNIGVMRGDDDRFNPSASVQLCSIQTLLRRDKPFAGQRVLVIIDEAHRSASDSYVDHIFGGPWVSGSIFLGFTASPTRLDGKPLGGLYEALLEAATYGSLIKRGFVIAPDCYSAPYQPILEGVRVVHGDFEEGALGEVMRKRELVGRLVSEWTRLAHMHAVFDAKGQRVAMKSVEGPRRPTICFAVNIAHSQAICEEFSAVGVKIAHLDGTTPEKERRAMLRDLCAGRIEIVSNVGVLLEGTNLPAVKCILHARPTLSLVLWIQSAGRALRPWCYICNDACSKHPSAVPIILDHAKNYDEHGPPHDDRAWSLTEGARRRGSAVAGKICPRCFAYVNPARIICPHCSFEFPPPDPRALPQQTEAQLALRDSTPEAAKRELFDKMAVLARTRGYKPGFASAKFKEKYGVWPPRAWSEELKSRFIGDLHWQVAVEKREKFKREEAAQTSKPTQTAQTPWEEAGVTKEEYEAEMAVGQPPDKRMCVRCGYLVYDRERATCSKCGHGDLVAYKPPVQDQDGNNYPATPPRGEDPWGLADDGDSLSSWLDERGIR